MNAADTPPLPTDAEVRAYRESCSNWGRWGSDDTTGTPNLITPEVRIAAAGLVRTGRAVSLSRPWNTTGSGGNPWPATHFFRIGSTSATDYLGIAYHGPMTTHIDALCHIFDEGRMFNGRPASEVGTEGAAAGVDRWKDGLTTRGVLIDIPRFRGVDFVDLGEPVRGWELVAAAKAQGVVPRAGDAVFVYSGREQFYAARPERADAIVPRPGCHADICPVLKEYDAALLGWDMFDAMPSGYPSMVLPVHVIAMVWMGLPLIDNCLLEPLAQVCREEGRWEFLLTLNSLYIPGATGSPVNPVAIF